MAKNKAPQTSFELGVFDLFSESLNEPQKQNIESVARLNHGGNKHPGGGYQPKGSSKLITPPNTGSNAVKVTAEHAKAAPKASKKSAKIAHSASAVGAKDALELARENYREYSIYVGSGRAYPCIIDGAKSSYKRAIYGMWKDAPRNIVKVAELAAAALPYHPHPTSISGVIVALGDGGNKFKFMKTQGNWGDSSKDIQPSADRYIGGMISDTALSLLCDSIEYCNYITGEIDKPEPEALPTLLPLCFINGQSGIPSGLPKLNIPCLDIPGMFDYYIDILKAKDLNHIPKKLPIPNLGVEVLSTKAEWENILKTGKGSIRVAPTMTIDKEGTIVITALPGSKTAEHVRKIIEKEILLDKVDLRDESTYDTRIVIEKVYKKQCNMQDLFKRLYQKLQTTEAYNMAFFDQQYIYVPASFHSVVKANLKYLIDTHNNRLVKQIADNREKLLVLQIIESLKKTNNWKDIFDLSYDDAVNYIATRFKAGTKEVAKEVLKKPMSYLTKAHDQEIIDLQDIIAALETDQSDIYEMLIKKYRAVKNKMLKEINENVTIFVNN